MAHVECTCGCEPHQAGCPFWDHPVRHGHERDIAALRERAEQSDTQLRAWLTHALAKLETTIERAERAERKNDDLLLLMNESAAGMKTAQDRIAALERERDACNQVAQDALIKWQEATHELHRFEPVRRALERQARIHLTTYYSCGSGQPMPEDEAWTCQINNEPSYGPTPEAACANHPALRDTLDRLDRKRYDAELSKQNEATRDEIEATRRDERLTGDDLNTRVGGSDD